MQQGKITILSTRTLNDEMIDAAAGKGISIDVIPFIKTQPIQSIEVQQEIENALMLTTAVVFTSVNAVDAVAAEFEGQYPNWRIFCIGYATRQAVERLFHKNLIAGTASNAQELADVIISKTDIGEVIFFCGDQHRDELTDVLSNANIEVIEIVVYQTVALPQRIQKKYPGILFFSPSAVKSFFQTNKLDEQTVLFAIGDTTANELKLFSGNKIIVSRYPDKKNLLSEVVSYFESNPIHH